MGSASGAREIKMYRVCDRVAARDALLSGILRDAADNADREDVCFETLQDGGAVWRRLHEKKGRRRSSTY